MKTLVKEATYSAMWVFAGMLFGTLIGGLVILLFTLTDFTISDFYSNVVFIALALIGALLGALAAPIAWSKIYVEGLRGEKYVIKSKEKGKK